MEDLQLVSFLVQQDLNNTLLRVDLAVMFATSAALLGFSNI
jgi:hypothetical protein